MPDETLNFLKFMVDNFGLIGVIVIFTPVVLVLFVQWLNRSANNERLRIEAQAAAQSAATEASEKVRKLLEGDIDDLKDGNRLRDSRISELENGIAARDARIERLEKESEAKSERIRTLEGALESQKNASNHQIDDLQGQLRESRREIQNLQKIAERVPLLEEERERNTLLIETLTKNLKDSKAQNERTTQILDEERKQRTADQARLADMERQIQLTNQRAEQAMKDASEAKATNTGALKVITDKLAVLDEGGAS